MAKLGATSDSPMQIFADPPPGLRNFLVADASDVAILRM